MGAGGYFSTKGQRRTVYLRAAAMDLMQKTAFECDSDESSAFKFQACMAVINNFLSTLDSHNPTPKQCTSGKLA
jgi:hypothetical protein